MLLLSACSGYTPDGRLSRVAGMVSESPGDALSALDSIDRGSLSEADRHYHDLLTVKANDKAYNRHTSDSLILDVIGYYKSHSSTGLYPEALYYGGRVYSDLGDYPTALRYFREALDNLGDGSSDTALEASVLSQTGRLLLQLRLYDEAATYIRESIKVDEALGDTVNMVYDLQLLGGACLTGGDYTLATQYFNQAMESSRNLPESYTAKSEMNLARIKYETGHPDSALVLIRSSLDRVGPMSRNNALAYAAEIYLSKGISDTAYVYAQELRHSPDHTNRGSAYEILLSPGLRNKVSQDSLYAYLEEYVGILEDNYDDNQAELSLIQQGYYNYSRHLLEKQAAEHKNMVQGLWILALSSVSLVLVIVVLYYKNKNKKALIELHNALAKIGMLKQHITQETADRMTDRIPQASEDKPHGRDTAVNNLRDHRPFTTADSIKELREKLRNELLSLLNQDESVALSEDIAESAAYMRLQELISQKRPIAQGDTLIDELEAVVIKSSPGFKDNLELLTQSRLTSIDLLTALLIKCHVTPSQMCTLLCRSKGAIVSRRDSLCMKIFDERLGTKVIDGIIRRL